MYYKLMDNINKIVYINKQNKKSGICLFTKLLKLAIKTFDIYKNICYNNIRFSSFYQKWNKSNLNNSLNQNLHLKQDCGVVWIIVLTFELAVQKWMFFLI